MLSAALSCALLFRPEIVGWLGFGYLQERSYLRAGTATSHGPEEGDGHPEGIPSHQKVD